MSTFVPASDSHFQTVTDRNEFPFTFDEGTVELVELHDEPTTGVFPSLLSVYQDRGYESGYRRAVSDVLRTLFSTTEDFVRSESARSRHPESAVELRRLLHQFNQHVERRLQPLQNQEGYVFDGLGI